MSRDIKRTIIKCGLCERQFSGIEDKTVTKIYNMLIILISFILQ